MEACRAVDKLIESLAIYRGGLICPRPFIPNAEMSAATWWNPAQPLPGLLPIDAALAHLCP
jgi:8-oxo-dGTP diphosphatase